MGVNQVLELILPDTPQVYADFILNQCDNNER